MGAGTMERQWRVGLVCFRLSAPYKCPTLTFGYVELKMIIKPRWYAAFRPNFQTDNHLVFGGVQSPATVFPNRQYYEVAVGFRPDQFSC